MSGEEPSPVANAESSLVVAEATSAEAPDLRAGQTEAAPMSASLPPPNPPVGHSPRRLFVRRWLTTLGVMVLGGLAGYATQLVRQAFSWLWDRRTLAVENPWFPLLAFIALVGVAMALWELRSRRRAYYATVEMVASFALAVSGIARLRKGSDDSVDSGAAVLTLVTSVYLFIRSRDNAAEAAKEDAERGGESEPAEDDQGSALAPATNAAGARKLSALFTGRNLVAFFLAFVMLGSSTFEDERRLRLSTDTVLVAGTSPTIPVLRDYRERLVWLNQMSKEMELDSAKEYCAGFHSEDGKPWRLPTSVEARVLWKETIPVHGRFRNQASESVFIRNSIPPERRYLWHDKEVRELERKKDAAKGFWTATPGICLRPWAREEEPPGDFPCAKNAMVYNTVCVRDFFREPM